MKHMQLNQLKDNPGARKRKMRVGRGIGCTKGKTCGRGGKGQTARTGVRINGFEGGQTPIHRRLPKRGFVPLNSTSHAVINLGSLQKALDEGRLDGKGAVNLETLKKSGLIRRNAATVKLLARGELKTKLALEVTHASGAAKAAVEKAGGTVKVLAPAEAAA